MFGKISRFTAEVRTELSKASWPWDPNAKGFARYKELWDSTVVVLIAMLLIGGYIAAFDLFFINIVGYLTKP